MNGTSGHIIWTAIGALIGGLVGVFVLPGLFWAALLGGAMTAAALRVGYVIATADDGARDE
jgi:uncharacterized protein YqgC (DUF456 family)